MDTTMTSVGIIFGRFNPPHMGHHTAWKMTSVNDFWYVGTNKNTLGPKDPLPCDVKTRAMIEMWPEIKTHICYERDWLTLASFVFENHGDVCLKIYTDESWVYKTIKEYNNTIGKSHGFYNFNKIELVETPRLSSATEVRNAVKAKDFAAFQKAVGKDIAIDGKSFFEIVDKYLNNFKVQRKKNEIIGDCV
jgi:hypothetical protein